MNAPLAYRPDLSDWTDIERGEFCYRGGEDGVIKWVVLWPHDCRAPMSIPCNGQRNGGGSTWELSGPEDSPTLRPSINWVNNWHGWLTDGVASLA